MHAVNTYDVILAGGGAAGLSLAYQLRRAFPNIAMLIVDEEVKNQNDHTWCYWSTTPSYVDTLAYRTWDRLAVYTPNAILHHDLAPYRYHMVRAIDFYRFVREELACRPGVQFLRGTIRDISESEAPQGGFAEVMVNEIAYRAKWVFDSRYRAETYRPLTRQYHYLTQHFLGWEIEAEEAIFDPQRFTMFDFRTPQQGAMRFFYVLPYTEKHGLVEYTLFSDDLLPLNTYRRALEHYIEHQLGITHYRVLEEERDLIPMTDHPYPRRVGRQTLNIGTRGGRVKPSSGYAFQRIQDDAVAITQSLERYDHPFAIPKSPGRYRLYDTMLLQILHRHGHLGAPIFARLFQRNPVQRVFRFLDEEDGLWENLKLMASVPSWPFVRAWLRISLLRRV